jgi:hypothetical protein
MEFATEMVIRSSLQNGLITEVPVTLRQDGRTTHTPHLKTFRDGWRTLRFFLMCSPRWLFLYPGCVLGGLGLLGYAVALPGVRIYGVRFGAHTLLVSTLAILVAHQALTFAVCAKTMAIAEGLLPPNRRMAAFYSAVTLERGIAASGIVLALGIALLAGAVNLWRVHHFGDLDYTRTMRLVVPGVMLTALGVQNLLASFLIGLMRTAR